MTIFTERSHSSSPWATYIQSISHPPPQPHPRLCHHPIHTLVLLVEVMAFDCTVEDLAKGCSSVVSVAVNVRAIPALFLKVWYIR